MKKRLTVLQVHTRYRERGGEDTVVEAEADLLRAAGHDVVAYGARNPDGAAAATAALALSSWNPAAARALRAFLTNVQPDVAHVHNTWYAMSPAVVAALDRAGVPVVMTLHNYRMMCANGMLYRDGRPCEDCVGTHPWRGVRHGCYRGSAFTSAPAAAAIALHRRLGTWDRHVRLFLATTGFAKERFVLGGMPPERIKVKPHFTANPGPRAFPPSSSRQVLCVGRLSHEKGVDVLVDAFAQLDGSDLELVVIGSGPERPVLERAAGPNVRFTGLLSRAEVLKHMLGARALAFPSRAYETFGLSVVEAMSAGLPVLASDRGGTGEILGGKAGWLVEPGDPAAWVAGVRRLSDDDAVDTAGHAARENWQRRFSPATGLDLLEDAYRLVGDRDAPDP
jgi:glycosyltransferase involved in cell wall biosynthesis